MKKCIAALCALLLVCCAAATSFAATLVKPDTPETFRALVGGKSFSARVSGLEAIGQDEDTRFLITVTVCERDLFDAAVIDSLEDGDIIRFGNGTATVVKSLVPDEFGVTVISRMEGEAYRFDRTDDGHYTAATDTDYPFWTDVFTITVPLEKDVIFLDWSDPENLEGPVKLGFDELLDHLLEGTDFCANNTKVTFDENGRLAEFLYSYSPWN